MSAGGKLQLTEEWAARMRERRSEEGSGGKGNAAARPAEEGQQRRITSDRQGYLSTMREDTALGPGLQEPQGGGEGASAPCHSLCR
jgi:hypothetical protein